MRAAWLASTMASLLLFSGCTSGDRGGSLVKVAYDSGSVVEIQGENGTRFEVLVTNGTGAIVGEVLNEAGFGLPGARVTVWGADHGANTNQTGWFQITNVPPGKRAVRAEMEGYFAAESEVLVRADAVTRLAITLPPKDAAGYRPHIHDFWAQQTTYVVFEGQVTFDRQLGRVPPRACLGVLDPSGCTLHRLKVEDGRIVPPGTDRLTFEFNVRVTPVTPFQNVRFTATAPAYDILQPYPRASFVLTGGRQSFGMNVSEPIFTDHGHARHTAWTFDLYHRSCPTVGPVPGAHCMGYGDAYSYFFGDPIEIKIVAHKGGLVADPPHPRVWKESDRVPLNTSGPAGVGPLASAGPAHACAGCARSPVTEQYRAGKTQGCDDGCIAPIGVGVAPGTTRIEFDLEHWWQNAMVYDLSALHDDEDWVWGYKTAKVANGQATWGDYTWLDPVNTYDAGSGREGARYVIEDITADQTDPFYSGFSSWIFMPAVRGHEADPEWTAVECDLLRCGQAFFEMKNVFIINENRDTMLAAGDS